MKNGYKNMIGPPVNWMCYIKVKLASLEDTLLSYFDFIYQ